MSARHGFCVKHDLEFESTSLVTGEYSFCASCQNEIIEENMAGLRVELADKGYQQYADHRSEEVA